MNVVLSYVGGAMALVWGISHLVPTRQVAAGLVPISDDNRRILIMEWIAEGAFLVFLGVLVVLVTAIDHRSNTAGAVYISSVVALVGLAGVSLLTGFKVKFLPFRLCPVIFTISGALILLGALT